MSAWLAVGCVAGLAFTLSSAVGMGGSLVLVPALVVLLGAREGVATAALLLAANNVLKTAAYRHTLPWIPALPLILAITGGSILGARLLLALPEAWVSLAVVLAVLTSFIGERTDTGVIVGERRSSALLALSAGALSGVSGTSGPLKGIAVRRLGLDRTHMVGAATLIGLFADVAKAGVFLQGGLLDQGQVRPLLALAPVMVGSVWLGRRLNALLGERRFAALFWAVMAGYSVRLLLAS